MTKQIAALVCSSIIAACTPEHEPDQRSTADESTAPERAPENFELSPVVGHGHVESANVRGDITIGGSPVQGTARNKNYQLRLEATPSTEASAGE